jgi:uncharacterized protein YeaO (DUF488 family)
MDRQPEALRLAGGGARPMSVTERGGAPPPPEDGLELRGRIPWRLVGSLVMGLSLAGHGGLVVATRGDAQRDIAATQAELGEAKGLLRDSITESGRLREAVKHIDKRHTEFEARVNARMDGERDRHERLASHVAQTSATIEARLAAQAADLSWIRSTLQEWRRAMDLRPEGDTGGRRRG